jgi:hypothetical protein
MVDKRIAAIPTKFPAFNGERHFGRLDCNDLPSINTLMNFYKVSKKWQQALLEPAQRLLVIIEMNTW